MTTKTENNTADKPDLHEHGEVVITISELQKSFRELTVLKNISLKLYKGENLVVLGKSGSGKSVLIKCIVRLLNFDSGTIEVFGDDVSRMDTASLAAMRLKIGFLFQSGALYDSMTVKDNLKFQLTRIKRDLSNEEVEEKILEILESVNLADALDKMPSALSGGMRKRIGLARTIVADPLIMLYDEPTTGLDPVTSNEISQLINQIQEKYKTSSIVITHDIACTRIVADRIVMLSDGVVYKEGTLADFEQSTDPEIKAFFQ